VEQRVKNIFNNSEEKPDVIIIKNSVEPFIDDNFFYVTGLHQGVFEGAVAALYPDGNIDLVVSELEAETAKKADVNLAVYKKQGEYNAFLKKLFGSHKKIGLNFNGISHKDYCKLRDRFSKSEFLDVSEAFMKTRLVKDEMEIRLMKTSCRIVDRVVEAIPDMLKEGMHEYEVASEIDYLMGKNGVDKPAFETISSFGRNTAEPHYSHGDTRLKKGDLALFDFGACLKKYNSDITRTFVFGEADSRQREMHTVVYKAQSVAFEAIKPGVKASRVHELVSSYIDGTKFKGRFIHSTGHSIGLAVHDGRARLGLDNDFELKKNMAFTVEPGVYIPGFGGVRIEDDIIVKKDGVEFLTKSSRELIEV
jgi:Xaa-Pro dipeptidase